MKTLLLNSVILLMVLCSCSGSRSFLHQRYTSYKHKKQPVEAGQPSQYAAIKHSSKPVENVPVVTVMPVAEQVNASQPAPTPALTASARIAKKLAVAPKLLKTGFSVNEPYSLQKNHNSKTFNKQLKQQAKHGLLFGVIDAILAIILSVIFVGLIVLLVLILI